MLQEGNFFTINNLQTTDAAVNADLEINAKHIIFDGHFPGQPVVPGVCMMQMIKELLEKVTGKQTDLVKAAEMKFLAVIDPGKNSLVHAELKYTPTENGNLTVTASLSSAELTHFKFKGQFVFR